MMIYQGFWNYACDLIQIPIQETIKYICFFLIRGEWIAWVESGLAFLLDNISMVVGK
jgi:hypothetical protein